jgi:hypothetical protein
MPTTISVDEDLADELYARKARGESYADVIRRLIEQADDAPTDHTDVTASDPTSSASTAREPATESDEGGLEAVIDAVADEVLPGSGWKLEERREALHAVVDYLREHGTATPAEFRSEVYPDHTAAYTEGEEPATSWWKNCMYPGLSAVAERTDEVYKADQSGEWRYADE